MVAIEEEDDEEEEEEDPSLLLDDDEKNERVREEENEKKMTEELERMQSMTHEEIVEKIMQLKTKRDEEEDEDDGGEEDEDEQDLTGREGTKFAMIIAQGMRASLARLTLKKEIESRPADWQPPPEHEAFLKKLRNSIYKDWKPDMPSLQRDCDEQEARREILERREEKARERAQSSTMHKRGDLLKALPNDGKSIQRKKEGTKLKKNDPEAQGGVYDRRKMQQEGAGLFVAPMMPEKVNREIGKLTRKSAGKGWFDLPAAEYTPELKRDMRTLKLRGAYDPKRFYKNADTSKLPTHFSIGTVVEGAQDFHSSRMTKKERGRTFAEEIAKDAAIKKARTNRFVKLQNEKKGSGGDKRKSTKGKKK
jgi:hypothetical protein